MTISADIFHCHQVVGATSIWKVEAEDATKHSPMHKITSTAKNYLAQNDSSAEVEK